MSFSAGQKLRESQLNLLDLFAFSDDDYVGAGESTTSTSYVDLTTVGPEVTITSKGTLAFVLIRTLSHTSGTGNAIASVDVSGATTISATTNESNGLYASSEGISSTLYTPAFAADILTITPGTNTYKLQYRSSSGGSDVFKARKLIVFAP